MIFYDVQLEENMKALGMAEDGDLILAVNRLKSLQKLYLFEQKGGENYLSWAWGGAMHQTSNLIWELKNQ